MSNAAPRLDGSEDWIDAASDSDTALDGGSEDRIEAADVSNAAPPLDEREHDGGASPAGAAVVSDAPEATDVERIPWRRPDAPEAPTEAPTARPAPAPVDDDPFLAELRRAVDDPEPLGPREEDDVWFDDVGLVDSDDPLSGRLRRRRQR